MAETKQEVPQFRVVQAPGFASGLKFYVPGEVVAWEVPDGWDAAKNGKHFAQHRPSETFEPLNQSAKVLLEKTIAERRRKQ